MSRYHCQQPCAVITYNAPLPPSPPPPPTPPPPATYVDGEIVVLLSAYPVVHIEGRVHFPSFDIRFAEIGIGLLSNSLHIN